MRIIKDVEPDSAPLPAETTLTQLVKAHLQYDAIVMHDFTRSRVAMVTVQLQLYNCSDANLQVEINTSKRLDR